MWESNIKIDFKEIGCEGVHWICLAQDRGKRQVLYTNMNSIKDGEWIY